MRGSRRILSVCVAVAVASITCLVAMALEPGQRGRAMAAFQAGNFRDAYDALRQLALDPKDDPRQVGKDLATAIQCLQNLGRLDEDDAFREKVIEVHSKNWRLLAAAAQSYASDQHFGYIVGGKFYRGWHRGGGKIVNSVQRDRVRALQLMQRAQSLSQTEPNKSDLSDFYLQFADTVRSAGAYEAWRLQYLTDLSQLPDYEEGYSWWQRNNDHGAPVDAQGKPLFYHVPKSYQAATNDGERWRWLLMQSAETMPGRLSEVEMIFADFLRGQFGVQTMAYYGAAFQGDDTKQKTGIFAVHTLHDDETIARLANGIKRFTLPDEFNWIRIYQRVASRGKSKEGEQARDNLATAYSNRRQYVKAADAWREAIAEYGAGTNNHRQAQLDQIVGNWGRFESGEVQPAGRKATVDFRFRNGHKASFEAHRIDVAKLLDDVKAYLKSSPNQLDWSRLDVSNIGYRLINQNQGQYIGEKVAAWDLDLKPRPAHEDARLIVTTPLEQSGAYMLTATMANGNTSRIVVWISNTLLIKKPLDGAVMYYVADAASGRPIEKADVDIFGYRQVQIQPGKPGWRVETVEFNKQSDADGLVQLPQPKDGQAYQWLAITRKAKTGRQGGKRLAYLGFSWTGFNRVYDAAYNQTHVFTITDRPVYRPQQTVHFKFWVGHARYDQPDASEFADKPFAVQINDPQGQKILEQTFTADAYGGVEGEYRLPKDAKLGAYSLFIVNQGGGQFRVEEYKKPEFEVTVEAPKKPVRLGEVVAATIKAKYYFGSPVTRAKVKYTVLRTSYSSTWYPHGSWDWLYGSGYWWFAADYPWYPGWGRWGCVRPTPIWWGRPSEQPEIVAQDEVPINPDGTVFINIDTRPARAIHPDQDHQYTVRAEVTDESRRTITGTGEVLVGRQPFKVFTWLDRGHYQTGDTIHASFKAQTLSRQPVEGHGELTLFQIHYNAKSEPVEKPVQKWQLDTNDQGEAQEQITAAKPGQYRLSFRLTDSQKHTIEGGYLFVVRGNGFDGHQFRFNDIELVTDRREYTPGQKVNLLINTNRNDSTVLLFIRPANGVYLPPTVMRLKGKSVTEAIAVTKKDMPNFFVEAVTVFGAKVYSDVREVVVPPEKRVLKLAVLPSQPDYLPAQKATVQVKLTDFFGKPFVGSTVLTIYDKSVEYISGGSNVPDIREVFWKWRRSHFPQTESSSTRWLVNIVGQGETPMQDLGVFGSTVVEQAALAKRAPTSAAFGMRGADGAMNRPAGASGPIAGRGDAQLRSRKQERDRREEAAPTAPVPVPAGPVPVVRKNFADTAYWTGAVTTDKNGVAQISLTMPENLTAWKIKAWAMGQGTRVGEGEATVTTRKNLLVRLQSPRFFVQRDEAVLSGNIHNYLKTDKLVTATLELSGGTLSLIGQPVQQLSIPAGSDRRVDWRVRVENEGQAVVRMKAVSDEESDAMEMTFPALVHGMLKTDSFSGAIRPDQQADTIHFTVPADRRVEQSELEVRYSPTLAGAMVDALPYMVEYPYGCTEQTLNRFLPTVVTQRILQSMKLNLKDIEQKRTNLNAQEIGNDKDRAGGWKRFKHNPVFSETEVRDMAKAGVEQLAAMQCSDGGWGWFSGWGEHSWPHTTAIVVHGLQVARDNDVAIGAGVLERGVAWLQNYQSEQLQRLRNFPVHVPPSKEFADDLDALVYMVLVDAGHGNDEMRDYLFRDRIHLAVYAKALFGLALQKQKDDSRLAMILKNIEQYVVQDNEDQTAHLKLPANNSWWMWYGSEVEADGYYLKLLARTDPKGETASRLVKYLLNNRKNATYWNSTRDTAVCIEAMADYLKASGEDRPDLTVEVWLDGKKQKQVHINASNLFSFDNKLVLKGGAVTSGKHSLELRKTGRGPVYFNAYLTNFTLEDFIKKAGLEVRVNRKYYKLTPVDKQIKVQGSEGQAVNQKVEKYIRTELPNLGTLKSGDLIEVELEIDSKNDYEYLCFEDPKAAGCEPVDVRSGYNANDLGAYMELRDAKVCFFVRALARGKHSVSYRLRAEIPGRYSALPTRVYAMYAPELKGNSDELKLAISD